MSHEVVGGGARTPGERFHSLDAVRGLAAMGVVMHHCSRTLPLARQQEIFAILDNTPLRLIFVGRSFVLLFFVLSGFVLACSLQANGNLNYRGFVIKRIFRIYVPYCVSLLFSLLVFAVIRPTPIIALSDWFNATWGSGVGPDVIAQHVLLIGTKEGSTLNNVSWSLVYELRISLIFPIIFWLILRTGPVLVGTTAFALSAAATIFLEWNGIGSHQYYAETPSRALIVTALFVFHFTIGAILLVTASRYRPRLKALGWIVHVIVLISAIVLMMNSMDIIRGFGAGLIVAVAISSPLIQSLLERPIPQFLGHISYSLYLVHLPILIGLTHLLYGHVSQIAIWALTFAVAIPVATLGFHYVEKPAMRFGRLLSQAIGHRWTNEQPPAAKT